MRTLSSPKKQRAPKRYPISFTVGFRTYEALRRKAQEDGRPAAWIMRDILTDALLAKPVKGGRDG